MLVINNGVVVKVNDEPPLEVVNVVEATEVDILKSATTPVVAPLKPETNIVHITGNPTLEGEVLAHVKLDAVVGLPYTTKLTAPPLITLPPKETEIKNAEVVATVVVEKENVEPLVVVIGVIAGELELVIAKSDA
jgi:hypothetical protein